MSAINQWERKLEEYRAKQDREQFINEKKDKFKEFFRQIGRKKSNPPDVALEKTLPDVTKEEVQQFLPSEVIVDHESIDNTPLLRCTFVDYVYYILCFTLWATVFGIFIQLQFGSVYFISSILIGMYLNTRTGTSGGEVSAYSVFNKNCESIPGTLKAEQFEREIRYGAAAVH